MEWKGMDRSGKEWRGQEWKGLERKGLERKGKEWKGMERMKQIKPMEKMITYKINYKKGCYEVIEYEIGEMDTPSISSKIKLKTNSLTSLEMLVTSVPTINFRMSHKVPDDIKEMLLKYRNVI